MCIRDSRTPFRHPEARTVSPSLAAQAAAWAHVPVEGSAPARSPDPLRPASSTSRRIGQTSFAEAWPSALAAWSAPVEVVQEEIFLAVPRAVPRRWPAARAAVHSLLAAAMRLAAVGPHR